MRKFKIKNAPKRRYVRRQTAQSTISFSRSFMSGLMPALLIGIALLATIIISVRPVDTISGLNYRIVFPSFNFSGVFLFYTSVINSFVHFFVLLTSQKVTITFTLPTIDGKILFTPFVVVASCIQTIWQAMITFISAISQIILWLLGLLDVRPIIAKTAGAGINMLMYAGSLINGLFISLFHAFIWIIDVIIKGTVFVIIQTVTALWFIVQFVGKGIVLMTKVVWEGIVWVGSVIGWLVTQTVTVFVKFIYFVFAAIVFLLQVVYHGIIIVIDFIVTLVTNIARAIWLVIEIPFLILGHYYHQIDPYMQILWQHMAVAAAQMKEPFLQLGQVSTEVMKVSATK